MSTPTARTATNPIGNDPPVAASVPFARTVTARRTSPVPDVSTRVCAPGASPAGTFTANVTRPLASAAGMPVTTIGSLKSVAATY